MFSFCPHCGQSIEQDQAQGKAMVCRYCKQAIGTVVPAPGKVVRDETDKLIKRGLAARCSLCQQVIQVKNPGATATFVPHYDKGKICKNSGKRVEVENGQASAEVKPSQAPATGKDLSAFYTRETIKLISLAKGNEARIEELSLAYLDKNDRVRTQIEALRDLLGKDFRMFLYPAALQRPELGLWRSSVLCVVGRKHPQGGYLSLTDTDVRTVLDDICQHPSFFV